MGKRLKTVEISSNSYRLLKILATHTKLNIADVLDKVMAQVNIPVITIDAEIIQPKAEITTSKTKEGTNDTETKEN